jgi:predicted nucleic acid-binding protein
VAARRIHEKAKLGWFLLFELESNHLPRIQVLMDQYSDLAMDLADASLVVLAEELGQGDILSTDQRDFHAYRWKNHYPFDNLLLPD